MSDQNPEGKGEQKDEMEVEDIPFPTSQNYEIEWTECLTKLISKKKPLEQMKRSQHVIQLLKKKDPKIDSKHQTYLEQEYLPIAVKTILNRDYIEDVHRKEYDNLVAGLEFLEEFASWVSSYIGKEGYQNLTLISTVLFDENSCAFYKMTRDLSPKNSSSAPQIASTKRYSEYTHHFGIMKANGLWVKIVNSLGEKGLENLISLLEKSDGKENKVSLESIKAICKIFYEIRDVLLSSAKAKYIPRFQDGFFNSLQKLSEDDLRPVKRDEIEDLIRSCKFIVETTDEMKKKGLQNCDQFTLEFGLKCLKTNLLEKRLWGISFMEQVVNSASPFHPNLEEYSGWGRYLDSKTVIEWLDKNNIIEEIFVSRPHEALIHKSERILVFLGRHKGFTKNNLEHVWNAIIGKHETIANASIDVLYEYVKYSNPLDELFNKVISLPDEKLTPKIVDLLYQLSTNSREVKKNTIEYFTTLCSDSKFSTVKKEVQEIALKKLIKVSKDISSTKQEKENLLLTCFKNIQSNESVCQSIIIFQDILNSFHEEYRFSSPDERLSLIENFVEKFNLIDILLKESLHMKKESRNSSRDLLKLSQDKVSNLTETIIYGIYPHMKQVDTRLIFLSNLIKHGKIQSLTENQIDQIWDIFFVDAIIPEEANSALNFFENLCKFSFYLPSQFDYIFKKILQLNPENFSEKWLDCFYTYFLTINKREKRISEKEETCSLNLTGFEFLWKIAISTRDLVTQEKAMKLIIKLYQRLSKDFDQPLKAAGQCMENCMMFLKEATQKGKPKEIEASIKMLKSFLDATPPPSGLAPHDRGGPLNINFINKTNSGPDQFMLRTYLNDPLSLLRKTVAAFLSIDNSQDIKMLLGEGEGGLELTDDKAVGQSSLFEGATVRLQKNKESTTSSISGEKKEKFDPMPEDLEKARTIGEMMGLSEVSAWVALKECRFDPDYTATKLMTDDSFSLRCQEEAAKLEVPQPKASETEQDLSPALILINSPEHLNSLFDLLQNDQVDKSALWNILMKLPTAQNLLQKIQNIQENEWSIVFDLKSGNVYKLLYNLQVASMLIESSDGSKEKEEVRLRWCSNFLHKGGFHQVFKILTKSGIEVKYKTSGAWQNTLSVLLKIINFFIKGDITNARFKKESREFLAHSGETLKNTVDYPALIRLLLQLIPSICEGTDLSSLEPALFMLLTALKSRPELLDVFYNFPNAIHFITNTLTAHQPEVRKLAFAAFLDLCSIPSPLRIPNLPHPHRFFLENLLKVEANENSDCFYQLLNCLIQDSCNGKEGGSPDDFKDLLETLVKDIKSLPGESDSDEPNPLLIGKIQLLTALVSSDKKLKLSVGSPTGHNMTTEVFRYLFSSDRRSDSATQTKCKSNEARKSALLLLGALGKDCPENLASLVSLLKPFHSTERQKEEEVSWNNPQILSKSNTNYVGLKNLGSICYVNSLMQQFFMTPTLRRDILSVPTEKKEDENLMCCIQDMFSTLFFSERKFHNPEPFCKSWRDWEGQPIRINEQQDVLEFFNVLCDHLEKLTKGTQQEKFLDRNFTGTFSQLIESKECEHRSETSEKYYAISVDIKGKSRLEDALETMVTGERLEGESAFSCSTCNKKVAAVKTTSIDQHSPLIIIHLKRFEYSVERQSFRKYNDKLAFPTELNIEPYTKQGLKKKNGGNLNLKKPPSEMIYNLVGVLVHTGEANMGHYYSFIKERNKEDPRKNSWFRFDDMTVTKFDLKNLEDECFGGSTLTTYTNYNWTQTRETPKTKSAYMLFYERADEKHIPTLKETREEIYKSQLVKSLSDIEHENYQLTIDRQLFDPNYSSFMKEILETASFQSVTSVDPSPNDPYFETIQVATFFVYETVMRIRDEKTLKEWTNRLKSFYSKHIPACRWFLHLLMTERTIWIKFMLFETFDSYVRDCFADLLSVVLKTASRVEAQHGLYDGIKLVELSPHVSFSHPFRPKTQLSSSGQFIQFYLGMVYLTRSNWRRLSQYFSVLHKYAKIGPEERDLLLRQEVIHLFIDYYMGGFSPDQKIPQKDIVEIFSESVLKKTEPPPQLAELFNLLAILVRTSFTEGEKETGTIANSSMVGAHKFKRPMSENDKRLLLNSNFFISCFKEQYNITAWANIIEHLIWEDKKQTLFWLKKTADLVCRADWVSYEPNFLLFQSLFRPRDSLVFWRSVVGLNWETDSNGLLDIIFHYSKNYPRFTIVAIKLFLQIVYENPIAASYAYHTKDKWKDQLGKIVKDISQVEEIELHSNYEEFLSGKMTSIFHRNIDYKSHFDKFDSFDPTSKANQFDLKKY